MDTIRIGPYYINLDRVAFAVRREYTGGLQLIVTFDSNQQLELKGADAQSLVRVLEEKLNVLRPVEEI
ncbi:MAG TPA: hypothetical protein VFG50_16175 [Rhodothermales bacterium]|nr:hypothetical protein [Rhodothermales bacterium]